MNPFLLKYSKDLEDYDSLRTYSSKSDSTAKKLQESYNPNSLTKLNDSPNKEDKITEFNSGLPENSCIELIKEKNNPSEFEALFPLNHKEGKKKRCSTAFARFKKRYSLSTIEEEKKLKDSDKIKNIVEMIEMKMNLENFGEKNKGFLDRRNAITKNEIPMKRKLKVKNQKKKGQKFEAVDIE